MGTVGKHDAVSLLAGGVTLAAWGSFLGPGQSGKHSLGRGWGRMKQLPVSFGKGQDWGEQNPDNQPCTILLLKLLYLYL